MKNKKKINKRRYLFLALVFFFTNFLTFKTLKKVEIHDIKIQGSKLFSKKLVLIKINRIGNFKDELFTTSFCENN